MKSLSITTGSLLVFLSLCGTMHTGSMPSLQDEKISISVDIVELILKYRVAVLKMLYGSLTEEGLVIGRYAYGDQKYSIHTFSLCEKYAQQHDIKQPTLSYMLQEAKKDFMSTTKEFLLSVDELRKIFFQMLQVDISKKPQKYSFLWFWSSKKDEPDVLEEGIETFQQLEHVLVTTLEVLNSLLYTAPKAVAQCYERIEKWQKIRTFLEVLEKEGMIGETFDKLTFLRFIKYNYLDVLRVGEFTKEQIEIILHEYMLTHT